MDRQRLQELLESSFEQGGHITNRFGQLSERYDRGMAIQEPSGVALPQIVHQMENLTP